MQKARNQSKTRLASHRASLLSTVRGQQWSVSVFMGHFKHFLRTWPDVVLRLRRSSAALRRKIKILPIFHEASIGKTDKRPERIGAASPPSGPVRLHPPSEAFTGGSALCARPPEKQAEHRLRTQHLPALTLHLPSSGTGRCSLRKLEQQVS